MAVKALMLVSDGPGAARELFPVANRPIVFHALDAMTAGGIRDVAVCGRPERLAPLRGVLGDGRLWDLRLQYVEDEHGLPATAVRAAGDYLDGAPFLFQHADGLLQDDLSGIMRAGADLERDALVLMHRRDSHPAAAGAQLLGAAFASGTHRHLVERGADREIAGLVDGLGQAGEADVRLVRGWRRFAGADELLAMNRILLDGLTDEPSEAGDARSRVEGRVRIHPTAVIEDATIRGPVVIEAGAQVRSCHVGPYTAIGAGAWLEGIEIEHSIVRSGARLLHVGERFADTVIGRDAKVTREFGRNRSLRMDVGDGACIVLR